MADSSPTDGGTEYRAIVVCTFDPCSYCRAPATEHRAQLVHPTEAEALEHGRGLAHKVWGASVHHVEVESRLVPAWQRTAPARLPVPAPARRVAGH